MKIVLTISGSPIKTLNTEQQSEAYEEIRKCLKGAANAFQKQIIMLTGFTNGVDLYAGLSCAELGIPWIVCLPKNKRIRSDSNSESIQSLVSEFVFVGADNEERDLYMIEKSDSIIYCTKKGSKKNKFAKKAISLSKQIVSIRIS